jgi:hypothetical protein
MLPSLKRPQKPTLKLFSRMHLAVQLLSLPVIQVLLMKIIQ